MLDRASLVRTEPTSTGSSHRVLEVARGLARVEVELDPQAAQVLPSATGTHIVWPLPFAAAATKEAKRSGPELALPFGPPDASGTRERIAFPVETCATFAQTMRAGLPHSHGRPLLWLDADSLHAFGDHVRSGDGGSRLTYPVQAARLAGSAQLPAGTRLGELLIGRHTPDGNPKLSETALWLEVGTTLELDLTDFAGGSLVGSLAVGEPGLALEVRMADGEDEPRLLEVPAGAPLELELPAFAPRARCTLTPRGPAGALLRLDRARIDRARSIEADNIEADNVEADNVERPNVLLIVLDTLRADRLAAFGGDGALMPNLDAFANESLGFTEYWAASSWTLPTISTMLTSVHAEIHGGVARTTPIDPRLDTLASVLRDAGYRTEAITEGGLFASTYHLDRGFDRFEEHGGGLGWGVELAREFFVQRAGEQPWFLTLHSYEVHEPYAPSDELIAEVRAGLPADMAANIERPSDFVPLLESGRWDEVLAADVPARMERLYDAEVRAADALIGGLLDDLERKGVLDDTLVIFTADHGEEFGEHGYLGHSDALYPEVLHVPLLMRFPGGEHAGERHAAPTSQLDLTPTVLDALGLHERLRELPFQGRSLLRGEPDRPVYAWRHRPDGGSLWAVRDGDRFYVQGSYDHPRDDPGEAGRELFDLGDDPGADRDRDVRAPDVALSMQRLLEQLRGEYGSATYAGRHVRLDEATRENLGDLGYL